MADITKIQIESGTYNIKDAVARNQIIEVNQSIENLENKINITSQKPLNMNKVIFIGDSYASRTNNWITPLISKLGLQNNEYYIGALGSTGFCSPNNNKTWQTLLEEIVANLTAEQKEEITHVIVCGGANDNTYSQSAIDTAIGNFVSNVNSSLPNAVTLIGEIGWTRDDTKIVDYSHVVQIYSKCNKYTKCFYLKNVEYTLHNYSLIESDNVHPTLEGCNQLAYNIYNAIMTGSSDIVYTQRRTSFSKFSLYEELNNNVCRLYTNASRAVNETLQITANGNVGVDLGDLGAYYIYGSYYQDCRCNITVQATDSNNNRYEIPGTIGAYGGHLYWYPLKFDSLGNYLSTTLTSVIFPQFSIICPSLSC